MKTTTTTSLALMTSLTCALFGLSACGAGAGDGDGANTPAESSEFISALPDSQMISITDDEANQMRSQALEGIEAEEDEHAANFRDHVEDVREGVQDLVDRTHEHLDKVIASSDAIAVEIDGKDCRMWDYAGARIDWRLVVCREEGQRDGISGKAFGWLLAGRALDAAEDAEYDPIAAGIGARLERADGKRGGTGRVYYDFDNFAKYTGESYAGKLGIGYRAAGKARQAILGLKDFTPNSSEEPRDALYRYDHVIGKGGRFIFLTHHDMLVRDMDGHLGDGVDGVDEYGRVVLAWNTDGQARLGMAACGGSVGTGQCVFLRQCYQANGMVNFEQLTDSDAELTWEAASCGRVLFSADNLPEDGELEFGGMTEEVAIPGESDDE